MAQFLADIIDQLDLALDQLAVYDRNFDRFSLMLIDNVVELILHKHAQDNANGRYIGDKIKEPKFNKKVINKALGQNFDDKVKLARNVNLISDSLADSILYLHSFRNTSYHKGQRHEGILHSLTVFYFQCTCHILQNYSPSCICYSSADKISYRAHKYLGKVDFTSQDKFNESWYRLLEVSESLQFNIIRDLSIDMEKTIKKTQKNLEFLYGNSDIFSFNSHIKSWEKRLKSVKQEKDSHKVLKKYCDFMKQTESTISEIEEFAIQIDSYIQYQADIARGK